MPIPQLPFDDIQICNDPTIYDGEFSFDEDGTIECIWLNAQRRWIDCDHGKFQPMATAIAKSFSSDIMDALDALAANVRPKRRRFMGVY